jgi:hypothetical protein
MSQSMSAVPKGPSRRVSGTRAIGGILPTSRRGGGSYFRWPQPCPWPWSPSSFPWPFRLPLLPLPSLVRPSRGQFPPSLEVVWVTVVDV